MMNEQNNNKTVAVVVFKKHFDILSKLEFLPTFRSSLFSYFAEQIGVTSVFRLWYLNYIKLCTAKYSVLQKTFIQKSTFTHYKTSFIHR